MDVFVCMLLFLNVYNLYIFKIGHVLVSFVSTPSMTMPRATFLYGYLYVKPCLLIVTCDFYYHIHFSCMFVLVWFKDRTRKLKLECQSMAKNDGYCEEKER